MKDTSDPGKPLSEKLKYLRLQGLAAHWDQYLKLAGQKRYSHDRLLRHIIDEEYRIKRENARCFRLQKARIPEELSDRIRDIAVRAFRATDCWGMARVDFFVDRRSGNTYINELNTHPGFTEGSMYPRLWEHSGIALPELIDRLVELAHQRHRERKTLEVRFRVR